MAKTTIHFKSQAECDLYFKDYLPTYPSKYLIIIDSVDADSSGETKLSNVLITSTNNYNQPGSSASVTMGTSAVETAQEKTTDNDQALTLSEYTLYGEDEDDDSDDDDEDDSDYDSDYFTIKLLQSDVNVGFSFDGEINVGTIYYWVNTVPNANRDNYTGTLTAPIGTAKTDYIPNLNNGDVISFYRPETTGLHIGSYGENTFIIKGNQNSGCAKIYGNLASFFGFVEQIPNMACNMMFYNSDILDASKLVLPWTSLSTAACYERMFSNCKYLINAPELPAQTLGAGCYAKMFAGCINLEKAPELTVEVLPWKCYEYMFHGCSKLNYIKCLATDISSEACLNWWVKDVSSTGTFIKKSGVTWPSGNNGIPEGWTVIEV